MRGFIFRFQFQSGAAFGNPFIPLAEFFIGAVVRAFGKQVAIEISESRLQSFLLSYL